MDSHSDSERDPRAWQGYRSIFAAMTFWQRDARVGIGLLLIVIVLTVSFISNAVRDASTDDADDDNVALGERHVFEVDIVSSCLIRAFICW